MKVLGRLDRSRVRVHTDNASAQPALTALVAGAPATLTDSISVNGSSATARECANRRAFLTPCNSPNQRSRAHAASRGQLISMLLPEASSVLVSIAHAGRMRMRDVTVPVA